VGYLAGLVILLEPVFEPFAPERHAVPEDITASFRQTCEALTTEGGGSPSRCSRPRVRSFTPPPSRIVVRLPIVRDPARLCRIKRAYLERHYRGVERVPFAHQGEPARFLSERPPRRSSAPTRSAASVARRDSR